MQRYLFHLGYCGSKLRGIQKQTEELEAVRGSVQGLLETGLELLTPGTVPQLHFSSRTDKGVHAVCNTAHVDLPCRGDGQPHEPRRLTHHLNRFFKTRNTDIRVHKTTQVPSAFHCRYDAVARKYLYRLAVTPPVASDSRMLLEQFFPSAEINRLYLVRPPFNIERLEPVCRLLEGTHDFASFANAPRKNNQPKETVRHIHSINVTPGRPLLDPRHDPRYSQLQFWDVTIRASGFLYKQVRRTVGVLVSVAQGWVTTDDVQHMLDKPSHSNYISHGKVAPPDGLYLLEVEYLPHVFLEREGESGEVEGRCGEVEGVTGEVERGSEEVKEGSGEKEAEVDSGGGGGEVEVRKEGERESGGKVEERKALEEDCER